MSSTRPDSGSWRELRTSSLTAWHTCELEAINSLLRRVLASWGGDWGVSPRHYDGMACRPPAPVDVQAESWAAVGRAGAGAAWCAQRRDALESAVSTLFGASVSVTPLLGEVGQCCQQDLLQRLGTALSLSPGGPAAPAASCFSPWAGCLLFPLPWGARLLLERSLVEQVLRAKGALKGRIAPSAADAPVPVTHAVASVTLSLAVHLQGCELDIASLQGLQLGDVLRIRHLLEAPASVVDEGGRLLFSGFLARSRGRKAVELAPLGAH